MEAVETEKMLQLKAEINRKVVVFCEKQVRGSQITFIRAARRTGFDPFYIRRAVSGNPTPMCDFYTILQAFNTPTVYIDDFVCEVLKFGDEYKKAHGLDKEKISLQEFLFKNSTTNQ